MNFNRRGNHHKTLVGAIFSIIIKALIYIYVGLTFKSLLFMDENKNSTIYSSEPIENFGTVYYNQTGHFIFYVLRHQNTTAPIKLNKDTS